MVTRQSRPPESSRRESADAGQVHDGGERRLEPREDRIRIPALDSGGRGGSQRRGHERMRPARRRLHCRPDGRRDAGRMPSQPLAQGRSIRILRLAVRITSGRRMEIACSSRPPFAAHLTRISRAGEGWIGYRPWRTYRQEDLGEPNTTSQARPWRVGRHTFEDQAVDDESDADQKKSADAEAQIQHHHQAKTDERDRDADPPMTATDCGGGWSRARPAARQLPIEAAGIDLRRRHQALLDHRDPFAHFELAHPSLASPSRRLSVAPTRRSPRSG